MEAVVRETRVQDPGQEHGGRNRGMHRIPLEHNPLDPLPPGRLGAVAAAADVRGHHHRGGQIAQRAERRVETAMVDHIVADDDIAWHEALGPRGAVLQHDGRRTRMLHPVARDLPVDGLDEHGITARIAEVIVADDKSPVGPVVVEEHVALLALAAGQRALISGRHRDLRAGTPSTGANSRSESPVCSVPDTTNRSGAG